MVKMEDSPTDWRTDDEAPEAFTAQGTGGSGGSGVILDHPAFGWGENASRGQESDEDDGHGMGLMEAFESFNLRAEKRVQELLAATDEKLFSEASDRMDEADLPPPNTPSYVLMSDQYRLSRPPQFHHWRQCFPYLQVTGKSSFDQVPDEHIQIRPAIPQTNGQVEGDVETVQFELAVVGRAVRLEVDTSDPPQEELILADGEMEEVLEEDRPKEGVHGEPEEDGGDEIDLRPASGALFCPSPRTTKVQEAMDQITLDLLRSLVPSVCAAVVEGLMKRQQDELRAARLAREEAARVAHEAELARQAEFRRLQLLQEHERQAHEKAVAKAAEEERIRQEQQQQELLRLQREENDEEEIKIRTLAYSHTREWYQPNKKCFSHRGRQLTYLKPVLKVQERSEQSNLEAVETRASSATKSPTNTRRHKQPKKPSSSSRRNHVRRVSSPNQTDLLGAKSPSESSHTSQSMSGSRPNSFNLQGNASDQTPRGNEESVRLPIIDGTQPGSQTKQQGLLSRKRTWKDDRSSPPSVSRAVESASVAAPTRVYGTSPYRIPPAILKNDLMRDAVATGRQSQQRRGRIVSDCKQTPHVE